MAIHNNGTANVGLRPIPGVGPDEDDYVGKWLCAEGPYQKYIEALSWSNPSLKKPDPANEEKNGGKPLAPRNAAVALLESSASGRPEFEKTELDCVQLTKHFEKTDDAHNKRRIYIMEGLAPDYIATLGGHFFMDPTFFQRQERTCVWSNDFTPTSDALPQPSTLTPDTMFHVQYCELRQFNQALPNTFFFCDRTGRHVGMTAARTAKEKSTTGILRRKASWWSRKTSGGGWDVVILCDPQLEKLRPKKNKRGKYETIDNLKHYPFHEGYVDFIPPPTRAQAASWPRHPRQSMYHDLCHYFENHASLLDESDWKEPITSSFFLKKIVAAHYLQLIDYIKAMLPSLELKLTTAWLDEQEQWRGLQTISRRCGNYRDDIEDTLLSLGYPLEPPISRRNPDWKECGTDFQYIYFRLGTLKERADTLMSAMTGLASIAGNRQNLEEAKRVKRLNLLALFFIPLAYTSSLFSMQDNYSPGSAKFWVYWASALGAVFVTFVLTWMMGSAMDEAAQWKLKLKWLDSKEAFPLSKPKRTPTIFGGKSMSM